MKPITILEAHQVLARLIGDGSAAPVPPKRSTDKASGRQLWALNAANCLKLIEPSAEPARDEPPAD